jgi:hypothetical protein
VAAQKSYVEAVESALRAYGKRTDKKSNTEKQPSAPDTSVLRQNISALVADLEETEVTYLFCVEPLTEDVPLYAGYDAFLATTLQFYGLDKSEIEPIIKQVPREARERFHLFLAQDATTSNWMRNFLAVQLQTKTLDNIKSIRRVLDGWLDKADGLKLSIRNAWDDYRKQLVTLPDLKETMFNEDFGVSRVFLLPQVMYHRRGFEGQAGKPQLIPDLGRLFGALLSNRTSGEDLIILCGGPGSGKSTLCRVLASELAKRKEVHPVFLRLKRMKEGADVATFVEETLQHVGCVSRIADLRQVPNLVLILDGFDELVMASRSRLRQFFNFLREDLSTGVFSRARVVVSGRDTLFPNGQGLPSGSHVISLLPFDKARVSSWGTKWRAQHAEGPGHNFHPEVFLEEKGKDNIKNPLHHLVSWPLTLHLVARVHTRGQLDINEKTKHEVQKAYLYRSILADTAARQDEKAVNAHTLEPARVRAFVRALAWEMYTRSVDSLDPSDVMPLLSQHFAGKQEADLAELADVAVVSSPELTKGEETGFEFVHKSFAEYLTAEHAAQVVERVSFKAPDYDGAMTWRMTTTEACSELSPVLGLRLLSDEVQEMLEPMLGCFDLFAKGNKVDDVISGKSRKEGLLRIIERFEMLLKSAAEGASLDAVSQQTLRKLLIRSPLDAYGNYCAGLMIIGTAAARQFGCRSPKASELDRYFNGEPSKGAFWRIIALIQSGGIVINQSLAARIFTGLSVISTDGDGLEMDESSMPLRLRELDKIKGFSSIIAPAIERLLLFKYGLLNVGYIGQHGEKEADKFTHVTRNFQRTLELHSPGWGFLQEGFSDSDARALERAGLCASIDPHVIKKLKEIIPLLMNEHARIRSVDFDKLLSRSVYLSEIE